MKILYILLIIMLIFILMTIVLCVISELIKTALPFYISGGITVLLAFTILLILAILIFKDM